jgi:hypothetical protein
MAANVIVPAVTAVLIQGIQAWILIARMNGLTDEQLNALWATELDKFKVNTPDKLPDPE